MNGYSEDLDSLLDSLEYEEFDEAAPSRRSSVRSPSRQSSFTPRQTTTPASQIPGAECRRNLTQIETLSKAVQALFPTNSSSRSRLAGRLMRRSRGPAEVNGRRVGPQQTKMLAVLLPCSPRDDRRH
jgi:hypothetical protein